jgi:tetrahydromethanopterin S-methyltransferase subunit D
VPADNALDVSHYTLSPYGTLVKVSRDPSDSNALFIDISPEVKLVGLGVPFVLCVSGITDVHGTALDPADGNCAGIALAEPNLDHAMTYPNPVKLSDGAVTFARLTAQATVRIFTIGMHFIREVATIEAQGGATWDLRDDKGKLIPSGEYIYIVSGKNADGISVEGKTSKLIIVNDLH